MLCFSKFLLWGLLLLRVFTVIPTDSVALRIRREDARLKPTQDGKQDIEQKRDQDR